MCAGAASSLLSPRNAPGSECKEKKGRQDLVLEVNKGELKKVLARATMS